MLTTSATIASHSSLRRPVVGPQRRAISVLLTALLLTLGCGQRESSTPAGSQPGQPDLTIGMLAPLTGPGARFGESQKDGVQLAIDEINAAGGINGRRITLTVEDTKTEPPKAVTAFTRLAERAEVIALFGSAASLDVPAYLPQVDRAGIPHVLPVAVLPSITDAGSKFTFRSALNDKIAAQKMADFVVNRLGAKKIALLLEDDAFGQTGVIFGDTAKSLGVTPLTIERFKRGDIDLKSQLTKIRAAGATHIQFWGYYAEYALAAKQLRELGSNAVLMGNQAPVNNKTQMRESTETSQIPPNGPRTFMTSPADSCARAKIS